jgi:hypothetical protein
LFLERGVFPSKTGEEDSPNELSSELETEREKAFIQL